MMKKYVKKILLGLFVVLIVIQFFPVEYNRSEEATPADISTALQVPTDVQTIFTTSCYDCHSNNTKYPWYSKIQPGSWFMANHIAEGKEELNFNEFGNYSKRRQKSKLKSIASQIKDDEMPLFSYTLIHRNASLSEAQKQKVLNWVKNLLENY